MTHRGSPLGGGRGCSSRGREASNCSPQRKAEQFPSLSRPPPPSLPEAGGFSLPCPPPLPKAIEVVWPRFLFGVEKSKEEA